MRRTEQSHFEFPIDSRVYSPDAIKNSSYAMLRYCDIQLEDGTDGTIIAIIDNLEVGMPMASLVRQFRLELVRAAIHEITRDDNQQIRLLMATAAFSREVTEEHIISELINKIESAASPSTDRKISLHCTRILPEGAIYQVSAGASHKEFFRILSRMHFLGDHFVGICPASSLLSLTVEWRPGITQERWETQFDSLASECHKGTLKAVYVPVFGPASLGIDQASGNQE